MHRTSLFRPNGTGWFLRRRTQLQSGNECWGCQRKKGEMSKFIEIYWGLSFWLELKQICLKTTKAYQGAVRGPRSWDYAAGGIKSGSSAGPSLRQNHPHGRKLSHSQLRAISTPWYVVCGVGRGGRRVYCSILWNWLSMNSLIPPPPCCLFWSLSNLFCKLFQNTFFNAKKGPTYLPNASNTLNLPSSEPEAI